MCKFLNYVSGSRIFTFHRFRRKNLLMTLKYCRMPPSDLAQVSPPCSRACPDPRAPNPRVSPMADQGGMMLTEDVHKRPWGEAGGKGNPNHPGQKGMSASWDEECRRLTRLGIKPEELKHYELEPQFQSADKSVNKYNIDIVSKLNTIATYRRHWFLISVTTKNKKEMDKAYKMTVMLMELVGKAGDEVRKLNGVPVEAPEFFHRLPEV